MGEISGFLGLFGLGLGGWDGEGLPQSLEVPKARVEQPGREKSVLAMAGVG